MTPTTLPEHDKDFLLLSEIDAKSDISQRELSHKTGLSLGSVNLLIQKMIREGLLKMEIIPFNRVIYMLTPKGMAEKAEKTVRYVKHHYTAIQETKERIKRKLDQHEKQYEQIIVCQPESELKDLVRATIEEYLREKPKVKVSMMNRLELDQIEGRWTKTIVLYLPDESARIATDFTTGRIKTDLLI